ncbi:NAD(P)-dependent alcohol dehydrogenase [Bermanella marisrubri]|uniref:Alcohol dehydrogenase, zinc-containing n=1 Tax=Bermanella marisrubri TaxID=207949 RepID=Q1MXW9_9GAMM|nr:NAD(P)-dependent alcohol dehydrogenase [Bermanella marisrubri]EAT10809.1 alcohol dehydrogenase, zinc-containing [Oceanobacter sp. RED65] [Bermanella marisrubri]QIZ85686.1 NAD(P)-dependent alcohol dehydrogenase [Bermanella marisrubri]
MKAVMCPKYGDASVLCIADVPLPEVGPQQIRVKVVASSVTKADTMMRQGTPWYARLALGLRRPKHGITGTGFSGVVEALGADVSNVNIGDVKVGDEVFGESGLTFSTNAEYVIVEQDAVILKKPSFLSHEEACVMCDGPLTSFNFLHNIAKLKPSQRILINGASGSLGSAAVQLAKAHGAYVIAVCSQSNHAWMYELGADECVDYRQQDLALLNQQVDVIYDTVGNLKFKQMQSVLADKGLFMSPVLSMNLLWHMMRTRSSQSKRAAFSATGMISPSQLKKDLKTLLSIYEEKTLQNYIDCRFDLKDASKAHDYVDSNRKKGSVVLLN